MFPLPVKKLVQLSGRRRADLSAEHIEKFKGRRLDLLISICLKHLFYFSLKHPLLLTFFTEYIPHTFRRMNALIHLKHPPSHRRLVTVQPTELLRRLRCLRNGFPPRRPTFSLYLTTMIAPETTGIIPEGTLPVNPEVRGLFSAPSGTAEERCPDPVPESIRDPVPQTGNVFCLRRRPSPRSASSPQI